MSEIRHHPSDTTLMSYASGGLSHGLSLIVAAHLGMCPRCRKRASLADSIGGAVLDDAAPAAVSDESLEEVFRRIAAADPQGHVRPRGAGRHGIPAPLGAMLPEDMADIRWRLVGPGIRQAKLPGENGEDEGVKMLRIAPGRSVPQHGHGGHEMTLIVSGSYTDEIGRFQAGDIADLDEDVHHQPVSDGSTDCICIIATDAPLEFRGVISRLMQNFIRI